MNIQDFRFMSRGQAIRELSVEEAPLLQPIDIRGTGRARALLLLHGFSSSPAVFRAMCPKIKGYDAVVCPVLPGHADSMAAFARVQAKDWLAAAHEACEALLKDYQAVDVLGFSLGGLLACHLSQRYALNRLYLLAPALLLRGHLRAMLMGARVLHGLGLQRVLNRGGNLHTNQFQELAYRQLPLSTIIQILTLIKNTPVIRPNCPTDLFLGRFDAVVDSQQVAERFIHQPQVTIHWLEHSAHVLPLDGDIDSILACLNADDNGS